PRPATIGAARRPPRVTTRGSETDMPPRTQTRPRTSPARTAPRRPTSRRPTGRRLGKPARTPRKPLISADQRRELSGIGLVGLGVLLGVVLPLPEGGSLARPVHEAMLRSLGI